MVDQLDGGIVKFVRITLRQQLYKKDIWDKHCRLCRKVKDLIKEKRLAVWNELMNVDIEGSKKEFWAFREENQR